MTLSEDHRLLQDLLARLLSQGTGATQIWAGFARHGLTGLTLPEADGGAGLGAAELVLIATELGRHALPLPWLGSEAVAVPLLAEAAPGHWLGRQLAQGQGTLALAHLDQDAASVVTAACCADGWSLSGAKKLVLAGDQSGHFLITASAAGGPAIFLAPRDLPGLTVRPYVPTALGPAASVTLQGAILPPASCLLSGAAAAEALRRMQNRARLVVSAEMAGAIGTLLDLTCGYLKTRQQFGVPIASFQALQHAATEIFTEAELAVSMVQYGVRMLDAPAEAADLALLMVKQRVSAAARTASELALQLHGGIGMTQETQMGRIFARLASLRLLFGSEDACRALLVAAEA